MKTNLKNLILNLKNETYGNVSMLFAGCAFVIIIAVGGAIDVNVMMRDRDRAQALADSSVLQAAIEFKSSEKLHRARKQAADLGKLQSNSAAGWSVDTKSNRGNDNTYQFTTTVSGGSKTNILAMIGIGELSWGVEASTEYRPQKTELVLVLDVSQSMKYDNKMTMMKAAVVNFIENIEPYQAPNSYLSVSLIPYAEHVNFGQETVAWLSGTEIPNPQHSSAFHGCFRHYDSRMIGSLQAVETDTARDKETGARIPYCGTDASKVVLHNTSSQDLVNHVNGLGFAFGTGTDKGLDWARRLFDPVWRPLMRHSTVYARTINSSTRKYIVVLTDGKIVHGDSDQNGLKDGASGGFTDNFIPVVDPVVEFNRICDEIEAEGDISVYTIAYAVTGLNAELENALSGCATGAGRYYETGTDNLSAVFNEIRTDVASIVLTK